MKNQGGKNIVVIFLILGLLFPGFFNIVKGQEQELRLIINELAWMGSLSGANEEWIELFNGTDVDITLDSWLLESEDGGFSISLSGVVPAQGYFVLERSDDDSIPERSAEQIYSGALSNSGMILKLIDENKNLIDLIDASEAWPAGNNESKQTMARKDDIWLDSQAAGGTPGEKNNYADKDDEMEEYEDFEGGNNSEGIFSVFINEIVSDPSEDEDEWIELYSNESFAVDLNSWFLEDGSGARTMLNGILGAKGDDSFIVVEKPKGNLNNSGDIIFLKDSNAKLIDTLVYGDWNDGNVSDNAPMARDPFSLARVSIEPGQNKTRFAVTSTPSKGNANIITLPVIEVENTETKAQESGIIISEIYPNPAGQDDDREYIELYNNGDNETDLCEWQIGSSQGDRYRFQGQTILGVGDYLLLTRSESRIVLNNNKDTVSLYRRDKKTAIDKLTYEEAPESQGLNCINDDRTILGRLANLDCLWSEALTPGKANKIELANRAPVPDFSINKELYSREPVYFDSSDTFDPDGDRLYYVWDFGDGFSANHDSPDHIYGQAGEYEIVLKVSDEQFEIEKRKKIKVLEKKSNLPEIKVIMQSSDANFSLKRILPNPLGLDNDGEWIELHNHSNIASDLLGWQIDDGEGGSKAYVFKESQILASNGTILLSREDSGLALNNNGDEVRLYSPNKFLVEKISYGKAEEGGIYEKAGKGQWKWSLVQDESELSVRVNTKNSTSPKVSQSTVYSEAAIPDIGEDDIGKNYRLEGVVVIEPGLLSSQTFYMFDKEGMEVYCYKKDFPKLKSGDRVSIKGEISQAGGEMRIKIKDKKDVTVIGNYRLEAKKITSAEIEEMPTGQLLVVEGEIKKKNGSNLFVDDGSGEGNIYVKTSTGISLSLYKPGVRVGVRGVIKTVSGEKKLYLLRQDDIYFLDTENSEADSGQVLGESEIVNWSLLERDKNRDRLRYYSLIALALVFIFFILIYRKRRNK
jgi:PKD repeat protein